MTTLSLAVGEAIAIKSTLKSNCGELLMETPAGEKLMRFVRHGTMAEEGIRVCKCQRHDRFCNMGIYSLVSTSPDLAWEHNAYGQTK